MAPAGRLTLALTAAMLALPASAGATLAFKQPAPRGDASVPLTSASFYSPSGNISCEMDDGRAHVASVVNCQSIAHPHSVRLGLDGRLKICRGGTLTTTRCLGNVGERTPVLGYGKQISLRRFRCRSEEAGVTCTVIKTGKGFRIDRDGVRAIGR